MPLVRGLNGVLNVVSAAIFAIAGGFIILMMFHICADVVARSFFNWTFAGTLEIVSSYYMVAVCFLPLCAVELAKEHVFVEFFTQKLSPRSRHVLDMCARLLTVAVYSVIAISSGIYAWHMMLIGEFMDVAFYDLYIWPSRWIAAVGFGAAALGAVWIFVAGMAARSD